MIIKPGQFVTVETLALPTAHGHFGRVLDCDEIGLTIRCLHARQALAETGWSMFLPWHQIRGVLISDATDLEGFGKDITRSRAAQSAAVN